MKKVNLNKLTTGIMIRNKNSSKNMCELLKLVYPYKYNEQSLKDKDEWNADVKNGHCVSTNMHAR